LKKKFKVKFSPSAILRRLKHLGYSRKVVFEKTSQAIGRDMRQFISALKLHLDDPEMAIFVDESNKDRKAARRKYGWSLVGRAIKYRSPFNRETRFTLIGAADCYGFVTSACDIILHNDPSRSDQQPVDGERLIQYVRETLVPLLGNSIRDESAA